MMLAKSWERDGSHWTLKSNTVVAVAKGEVDMVLDGHTHQLKTLELSKQFGLTGYKGRIQTLGACQGTGALEASLHVDVSRRRQTVQSGLTEPIRLLKMASKTWLELSSGEVKEKPLVPLRIKAAINKATSKIAVYAQHANGYFN